LLNPADFTSDGVFSNLDLGTEAFMSNSTRSDGPSEENDTGALIRSAAVALVFFKDYQNMLRSSYTTCRFTHQNAISVDVCKLYVSILDGVLHGYSKQDVLAVGTYANLSLSSEVQTVFQRYTLAIEDLPGNNDAVEALVMVLHCFHRSNNYHEGLALALRHSLKPSHVAALYGQLAGAYYGLTNIKVDWIEYLAQPRPILHFAENVLKKIS
jgi:ADP-ribosylglycohydrolase